MATDCNPDVMERVEEELRTNPELSNDERQEKAREMDSDAGERSARSFNARYPLQVKPKLSSEQEERGETRREGVRDRISRLVRRIVEKGGGRLPPSDSRASC